MEEIKAFVPAKDFELSKRFYQDMGFTMASNSDGIAYFYYEICSFLLQNFYQKEHSDNFMMHVLVKDIRAWHEKIIESEIIEKYQVRISEITEQPWNMLDFVVFDPSGVLWRFGQNIKLLSNTSIDTTHTTSNCWINQ